MPEEVIELAEPRLPKKEKKPRRAPRADGQVPRRPRRKKKPGKAREDSPRETTGKKKETGSEKPAVKKTKE
jgi:hypothetical protein